jgi:hypothetical protein
MLTAQAPWCECDTNMQVIQRVMETDEQPAVPPHVTLSQECLFFLAECFKRHKRPTAKQLRDHPWIRAAMATTSVNFKKEVFTTLITAHVALQRVADHAYATAASLSTIAGMANHVVELDASAAVVAMLAMLPIGNVLCCFVGVPDQLQLQRALPMATNRLVIDDAMLRYGCVEAAAARIRAPITEVKLVTRDACSSGVGALLDRLLAAHRLHIPLHHESEKVLPPRRTLVAVLRWRHVHHSDPLSFAAQEAVDAVIHVGKAEEGVAKARKTQRSCDEARGEKPPRRRS